MSWNYRLIDARYLNAGDPWIKLAEVWYDENSEPYGYSWVDEVADDSVDGVKKTLEMYGFATTKPVLDLHEFYPSRDAMLRSLIQDNEQRWGPKCSEYEPGCPVCESYARLSEIPYPTKGE
jgi:hypothetical protein